MRPRPEPPSTMVPVALTALAITCAGAIFPACGEGARSTEVAPAVALSASPAATSSGQLTSSPPAPSTSATSSPAAQPSASAALTAAPRAPRPPADRPSAHAKPPDGVNKARWNSVFATYGRLLDIDDLLDDYHARHPDKTEVVTLATTHQGREVRALHIGAPPSAGRPSVLLNGAHHGDEPLSALIVLDAIDTLLATSDSDPRVKRYLSELSIWCVPLVNPDGFATYLRDLKSGRKNGRPTDGPAGGKSLGTRGVDLNRNYPFRWGALREAGSRSKSEFRSYRGPEPASEPETKAMVALSDREHFVASLSFHIGTVALLAPYTIDGVKSPVPNEAWLVADELARASQANLPRPVYVRRNLYAVDGTDQDYHRAAHGTLALLFEAAARSWEEPARVQKTLSAIRPSWQLLFDRYLDGPSVEGHVRDTAGHPISAVVELAEQTLNDGETWRSRCPDGFFGRYLPRTGRFTVRVKPATGPPIDTPIDVTKSKGRVVIDLVVPPSSSPPCGAESR